jgi:hypothetical protein
VLLPSRILSEAPNLVKILSTGVSVHFSAGRKLPIYARITARQDYLNNVDLPPMFGPVTKSALAGSSNVLITVLFGINFFY